jgi:hypothetical protein
MCAHPKPFHPAAALLCAFALCIGLGLLVAGLLPPDHPLPPIRTAQNQTPVMTVLMDCGVPSGRSGDSEVCKVNFSMASFKTPSAKSSFVPVSTPRSGLYVGVQSYALLSQCGVYTPDPPTQQMQANLTMAKLPAPCERRR